ncbi:MAG: alanine--tRNA ligase, partial [Erysipelotrichaceae bacterium]
MKQLTGNEVRQLFLDYFASKGHMVEPGAPLVPNNDPTLLWINSGVAALKKYFDGSEKPASPRITNAQKSIRTNDIENVGKTARHHTFFEMLGNFSIGDYFKPEAIGFAWEFLTDPAYIGMEKEKMYITVHPDDHEAYDIWTRVHGVDPSHILKTEYNYWQIGEGPCGPNTEIFYDRGTAYDPEGLGEVLFFEERDNDRYIEVWNVVFSQYDGKEGVARKDYQELPQKNIDTGMGLERLVSIIQDGETNFDTDLFLPIIAATQTLAAHPYEGEYKMAYRVIADHIRTCTFALADGALFSNEGRGYVLRRLLRRAVRFGKKLNINEAFLYNLVPVVYECMQAYYPYLEEKIALIQKLIKLEEERFHTTLVDGEKLLLDMMQHAKEQTIDGATAFKLYDTYGFPFELTLEIAQEHGYSVDKAGFDAQMKEQRERARASRAEMGSMASQSADLMNTTVESKFVGYETTTVEATIIALFEAGVSVDSIEEQGEVMFDVTPFYAESGGQAADAGSLIAEGVEARITDVKKAPHKQHLHSVSVSGGHLSVGQRVTLAIDVERRAIITSNHSATHLLQHALKSVVGDHITQAGSSVSEEALRFDFTHFEKVTTEQLQAVERLVNQAIWAQAPVVIAYQSQEEAKASGAMALFGEKYGDVVRVVTMDRFSKELCGGTHVSNTAQIGIFKITSEESVGSGVRRISGITNKLVYEQLLAQEALLDEVATDVKATNRTLLTQKVRSIVEENTSLKKELQTLETKMMQEKANALLSQTEEIKGLRVLLATFENVEGGALKAMADDLRSKMESC